MYVIRRFYKEDGENGTIGAFRRKLKKKNGACGTPQYSPSTRKIAIIETVQPYKIWRREKMRRKNDK